MIFRIPNIVQDSDLESTVTESIFPEIDVIVESREVEDNLRIGKSIELIHKIDSKRPFLDLPIGNTVSKLQWIENTWKHLIIESTKLLMVWYKIFYKWKLNCKKRATTV